MSNLAMTGLSYAHFAPITSNTDTEYTTDKARRLYGAMTLSTDQTSTSEGSAVAADDDPNWYAPKGTATQSARRKLTVGAMSLEDLAELTGLEIDENGEMITPRVRKVIPKYAFSIASLLGDNTTYRHMKFYHATIMGVEVGDINTRGNSAGVTNITIDMLMEYPEHTEAIRDRTKEAPLDLAYLATFTDFKKTA